MLSSEEVNKTLLTDFILAGFAVDPDLQPLLFIVFSAMYLITILGNGSFILLIRLNPCLHTPMYFFLTALSLLDICYSSVVVPNTLVNILNKDRSITLIGCAAQLFLFSALGSTECLLLSVMALDRYVAICRPLHYTTIMTGGICIQLVAASFALGIAQSLLQVSLTFRLIFCQARVVDHFICDVRPLLKLSCTDTFINEAVIFLCAAMVGGTSLVTILMSYTYIISALLKIPSVAGRQRTFSTCASHLTCVILFYGAVLFMYLRPPSLYSPESERAASVLYTVVIPMSNPLIYSLRNQEVKESLKKIRFCRNPLCCSMNE
ncbi:olfactory receptor 8U9-like [Pleurodeles waltl]|uniref:olfactory receptor 8U9-like n=1 Tax=Pleurodeles waltl TaxID=8319 RepID=UPI003709AD86